MIPKISVITVCLNNIGGLKNTRNSIKNQIFKNLEWIIIDGNSCDGTYEFLKLIKNEVKFKSEPDTGIYDAMNKGIDMACGEYLIFLNAGDCFYNKNVLKDVCSDLDADIVVGWLNIIKEKNGRKIENIKRVDNQDVRRKFLFHRSIPHQATFIHHEILRKKGGYRTNFKICGDHDFFVRAILTGAVLKYVRYPISSFPLNGLSNQLNGKEIFINEIKKIRRDNFSITYRVWRIIIDTIEKKMGFAKVQRPF